MLGPVAGKRVVELGAGIGRFTGALAAAGAASVLAVDFMEHLIAENRRVNGHMCGALVAENRREELGSVILDQRGYCSKCCTAYMTW